MATKGNTYQIIDWFYDNLPEDASFKNEEELEKELKKLKDPNGSIAGYLNSDRDWLNRISKKSNGPSLFEAIEKYNDKYKESIIKQINSATTITQLESLDIDPGYEDAWPEVSEAFSEAQSKLSTVMVEVGGEEIEVPSSYSRGRHSKDVASSIERITSNVIDDALDVIRSDSYEREEKLSLLRDLENTSKVNSLPTSVQRALRSVLRDQERSI